MPQLDDEFLPDDENKNSPSRKQSDTSTSQDSQVTRDEEPEEEQDTETSWAALSQIIVAFFLTFNMWGIINSFGVYQTYYASPESIGASNSAISWIGSLQAFLGLGTLLATGPLFDRGHARWLASVGIVLVVLGMMMTSISTAYWQIMLSQGLCMGLGDGCLFVVAVGQIALTFKTHKWMAFGLAQGGGGMGAIVYSEVFRSLQPSIGAGWATRTIAFIMLGTLLVSIALLRPQALPQRREVFDTDAFKNPPFLVFAIASFAGFMGLYIPFFYLQEYALDYGIPANSAANLLPILNAGSALGRVLPGFVADRAGLLNTYVLGTIGATVLSFTWLACTSYGSIVAFAVLYGFFGGCAGSLQPAVLAFLAPSPTLTGTWLGMGSIFSSLGLLLGSPLGGMVQSGYGWTALRVWTACLTLVCLMAAVGTRVVKGGRAVNVKV